MHLGGRETCVGVLAFCCFALSAVCWFVIKYTIGLRVTAEEEIDGLDHGEHGNEAYHGFQMVSEAAR